MLSCIERISQTLRIGRPGTDEHPTHIQCAYIEVQTIQTQQCLPAPQLMVFEVEMGWKRARVRPARRPWEVSRLHGRHCAQGDHICFSSDG
jgi:hypothetical protein